ncbi:hypothetical protein DFH07DRAFT_958291 [Mycena maculata]|uniref:Uncharacterized protein n=1 Tax=Mycena maculata TaxID=230809 RepID=A0AAD7NG37_9AGAR|nr:hypothetical protein DFH07DRAFT_958291 [Mycena maculata]
MFHGAADHTIVSRLASSPLPLVAHKSVRPSLPQIHEAQSDPEDSDEEDDDPEDDDHRADA